MPRIKADTVADHVAQQRAAVLDAAVRLFTTRGYQEVTLADIATEVGLARNSLYRYVPDKVHLLVEWYRGVVPETVDAWTAAVAIDAPAAERLSSWARTYLEWTRTPEHQLVAPLTESLPTLDPVTRAEVTTLHQSMMDVVAGVVADAGIPVPEVAATVHLLAGLVTGAARAGAGDDDDTSHRLDAAIAAIIGAPHRPPDPSTNRRRTTTA